MMQLDGYTVDYMEPASGMRGSRDNGSSVGMTLGFVDDPMVLLCRFWTNDNGISDHI